MNIKRFFLTLTLILTAFVVIFAGIYTAQLIALTQEVTPPDSGVIEPIKGRANCLVMGLDAGGTRADVMMLFSMDTENNRMDVISIPRDTKVKYNGHVMKINATMGYEKKQDATIQVVKELLGMPIHYYAIVNFEGFRNIIDILGGVEYNVKQDMDYDDPAQDLYIHVKKGLQVLNGKDAEGVVRFRHTYVMGDYDRINVQQDFLKEMVKQKLQPQYLLEFPKIAREIAKYVRTNMSVLEAAKYLGFMKGLNVDNVHAVTIPGEAKYIDHISYYVADSAKISDLIDNELGYGADRPASTSKSAQTLKSSSTSRPASTSKPRN